MRLIHARVKEGFISIKADVFERCVSGILYEDIKTIAAHRHRSAHGGGRIYQSDAFPEDQQGLLFMANIHAELKTD